MPGWIQRRRLATVAFLTQFVIFSALILSSLLISPRPDYAAVTGNCSSCHTMHNSQGGATMNWRSSPRALLLRNSCLGCHARAGSQRIVTFAGQNMPQVRHTDTSDLAGGNFAYMLGDKGSGASDTKGHNVKDFGNLEGTLVRPPGYVRLSGHYTVVPAGDLTCAGTNGCHGQRCWGESGCVGSDCHGNYACTPMEGMKGTHHRDVDGQLATADQAYNSYRFLWGVKGYEVSDWQNTGPSHHNDYFGFNMPYGYTYQNCADTDGCHDYTNLTIYSVSQTMSGFCATCHGDYHQLSGIGGDRNSPFTRHPTDIAFPSTGEYTGYTTFNVDVPISRNWVPSYSVSGINPVNVQVMCLSCHVAHGSNYDDLLRWDYTSIVAGGGSSSAGCFACHTTKDTGG